jgi:hypothetical protein
VVFSVPPLQAARLRLPSPPSGRLEPLEDPVAQWEGWLASAPYAATWANVGACRGQRGRPVLRSCVRAVCSPCVVKRPGRGCAPALRTGGSAVWGAVALGPTGECAQVGQAAAGATEP